MPFFQCANGECLDIEFFCDKKPDCADGRYIWKRSWRISAGVRNGFLGRKDLNFLIFKTLYFFQRWKRLQCFRRPQQGPCLRSFTGTCKHHLHCFSEWGWSKWWHFTPPVPAPRVFLLGWRHPGPGDWGGQARGDVKLLGPNSQMMDRFERNIPKPKLSNDG